MDPLEGFSHAVLKCVSVFKEELVEGVVEGEDSLAFPEIAAH